ncbi:MAG: methyltransferase domain-containing protein [Kiritimatiellae bacterium]|nr:methyltransferase domain-containing protein [Kiritimatiellia bacterium]
MPLEPILHEIAARYGRVRCGLDVGFGDEDVSRTLRDFRGGVWMSIDARAEFPFEDEQFEIVVMNGEVVSREVVREANRVLRPEGCLLFTVAERTGSQEGFTLPALYRTIREGFDILAVRRPKWWFFRRTGRTLTVCARKKAWREHKGLIREGGLPFTPFRKRT